MQKSPTNKTDTTHLISQRAKTSDKVLTDLRSLADLDMEVGAVLASAHPSQEEGTHWHFLFGHFVREGAVLHFACPTKKPEARRVGDFI